MKYYVTIRQGEHLEMLDFQVESIEEAVADFVSAVEAGDYHCSGECGKIEAKIELWKDEDCYVKADWDSVEATYEGKTNV